MGSQNYTLTVQNTTFIGNQTGMLTDASFPLNVVLINDIFMNNGNPNPPEPGGTTHGIYRQQSPIIQLLATSFAAPTSDTTSRAGLRST